MPTLDHATCCDVAEAEILGLADVIRGADLAMPVPTCPGWTLAELVTHLGGVHRWAAFMVSQRSATRVRRRDLDLDVPDDPAELPDWLAAGAALTSTAFRQCDPDASMWAWGGDQHARFWSRRMVHETVVHRADAELALGGPFAVAADVATDGIDELLDNLPFATDSLSGAGEVIAFVMPGVAAWRVELRPEGFTWSRGAGAAAVTVTAPPADLLLAIYGRRKVGDDGITILGDTALFECWIANSTT